jgi:hypothetical protein
MEVKTTKPVKAKPAFYAHCYQGLQKLARDFGYNLLLHGSMDRDMDLVAVPWIDEPKTHLELLQEFNMFLNGITSATVINTEEDILLRCYQYGALPGGRSSYIINLNRGGKFNGYLDEQYYLDISITPLIT